MKYNSIIFMLGELYNGTFLFSRAFLYNLKFHNNDDKHLINPIKVSIFDIIFNYFSHYKSKAIILIMNY